MEHKSEFATHKYTPQMELLCRNIPALRQLEGTVPWNPVVLSAQYDTASGGEQAAIAFVISVWSHDEDHSDKWAYDWGFPPFTLSDFARLDEVNRKAVAAWFMAPFWP